MQRTSTCWTGKKVIYRRRWLETDSKGVKLSARKLMVVRTSYSGMRESMHNETVSSVTSFSSSTVIFTLLSCIYRAIRIYLSLTSNDCIVQIFRLGFNTQFVILCGPLTRSLRRYGRSPGESCNFFFFFAQI